VGAVARYTKHNVEDWDFRDCSLENPSDDLEAENFLSANYTTVLATDQPRLLIIRTLLEEGVVEFDDDKRHVRFVIGPADDFLAGMKSAESRFTYGGRLQRSILESLRRENRKYDRLRTTTFL